MSMSRSEQLTHAYMLIAGLTSQLSNRDALELLNDAKKLDPHVPTEDVIWDTFFDDGGDGNFTYSTWLDESSSQFRTPLSHMLTVDPDMRDVKLHHVVDQFAPDIKKAMIKTMAHYIGDADVE